jgi:hypothetical protein
MNLEAYDQYLTPAAIVLVGLVALWLVARLVGSKVTGRRGNRLAVSEFHEIDKSRRLVLVRRDEVEHLIMIGGVQDMVIESGIGDKPAARSVTRTDVTPSLEVSPLPKIVETPEEDTIAKILPREPKPAVFGDRAPNLRPVERSEPRFSADKSTGESSS